MRSDTPKKGGFQTTYETRWYGNDPERQVEVTHKCESDPANMLKGMEEFLFKQANVINFGDKKTLVDNLHLAILAKDSFNHKVFSSNLQVKKAENAKIQPSKTQK